MDFNPYISLFKKLTITEGNHHLSVAAALEAVRTGALPDTVSFIDAIEKLRAEDDKKKRGAIKKTLAAVTWSGTFHNRAANQLDAYSGIICHDVDGLEPDALQNLKAKLNICNHVYACFVSPSGNGLKILFRTETHASQHLYAWSAMGSYLQYYFEIKSDPSCKDICRLCFLSYDPDLIFNEDALIIDGGFMEAWYCDDLNEVIKNLPVEEKPVVAKEYNVTASLEDRFLEICHNTAIKKYQPVQGSYNMYINVFSLYCLRYDIDEHTCANAVAANCGWASADKEDIAVITSVYKKFGNERGAWKENHGQSNVQTYAPTAAATPKAMPVAVKEEVAATEEYNEEKRFWFEKSRRKKEVFIDEETGEILPEVENKGAKQYEIDEDDFIFFLQNNGFYMIRVGKKGYRLVRLNYKSKVVDTTDALEIKKYIIAYLQTDDSLEFKKVRKLFRKQARTLTSADMLEGMEYYRIDVKHDTRTQAYLYFDNCYLEVGPEEINAYQYSSLGSWIWKDQIIEKKYTPVAWQDAHFALFLQRAIVGRKCPLEQLDDTEEKKWLATVTGIGYLLHQFKDPTITKAVLAVDKKIQAGGEHNGGTGKSLLGVALKHCVPTVFLNGKAFDVNNPHCFQAVKPGSRILWFDDLRNNFQFDALFPMITGEFSYKAMYQPEITVSFNESPKFYLSLNGVLKGDTNSFARRQHIVEFSDYYNGSRRPIDEFTIRFFDEWDDAEWSRFYGFMLYCIKEYLQRGLVGFPAENYLKRQLLEWFGSAGMELNDYLNESILDNMLLNRPMDQNKIFNGFKEITSADRNKITTQMMSTQVKKWAAINNLEINAHIIDGGRDRRSGISYLTFTAIKQNNANAPDVFDEVIAAREQATTAPTDLGLI